MNQELEFREQQRYKWWFYLLFFCIDGLFIYGFFSQVVLDKRWGNNPASNTTLIVITILVILLTLFFLFIHLDTFINKEGIYFRMFPFHLRFKFFSWDHIAEADVIKFNLFAQGGGWGIHKGFRYTSYTISGFKALKLLLKNKKKIYIGTQRAKELSEFLTELNANRNKEQKLRAPYR